MNTPAVSMIRAYHAIVSAYGFWLPNDPRGSWSDFVGSWELFRFGPATKTDTRRSVAARPHDHAARLAAKTALNYPEVHFDGRQALSIGRGFAAAIREGDYRIYACAILPEHVHLVVARSDRTIERVVAHLKAKATAQLSGDGNHPLGCFKDARGRVPTPWAGKFWKCFLDSDRDIVRAIGYVDDNPEKEGKPRQRWSFVTEWRPGGIV